jgi:hypothetical protein
LHPGADVSRLDLDCRVDDAFSFIKQAAVSQLINYLQFSWQMVRIDSRCSLEAGEGTAMIATLAGQVAEPNVRPELLGGLGENLL